VGLAPSRGGVLVDQNIILRNAPLDDGYDIARAVFNGMIDRRPALIARCAAGGTRSRATQWSREA
jgi:hypothetical protein